MSQINIIAAIDNNKVIGNNNDLVWKGVPGDMKRFVAITTNHPIIMGRKTFESFGSKPLPNRTNIIITRNNSFDATGCKVFQSIDEAINFASGIDEQIFVIGGGEIYKQTISVADRLYLTIVDSEANGNVFFPDYDEFKKIVSSEEMPVTEKFHHKYKFVVLEK